MAQMDSISTQQTTTDQEEEIQRGGKDSSSFPLALYGPLSSSQYVESFQLGDIDESLRSLCCVDPSSFHGKWRVVLGGRSNDVETIMAELGVSYLKRKFMAGYASITEIKYLKNGTDETKTQDGDKQNKGALSPVMDIATFLPMGNTKQSVVAFNNTTSPQKDNDTGDWQAWCIYINGRAIQRRVSDKGVMFDTRCIFNVDPLKTSSSKPINGRVQLFKWTFIPKGKNPIVCLRWSEEVL